MSERWYVGAFGQGHHKELPEACARRALAFLSALRQLDPCFKQFQYTRRVRGKMVTENLALEPSQLTELFASGVNRRDDNRAVIEELGFSIWMTTPGKIYSSLRIHDGTYGLGTSNSCVLQLPSADPETAPVFTLPVLNRILQYMIDIFDPDMGLVTHSDFRNSLMDSSESFDRLQMGWIMYFSRRKGPVPPLPAPVRIEPVGEQGNLIVLTGERVSAANPEHVELGRQVRKLLIKGGLGQKLPTDIDS